MPDRSVLWGSGASQTQVQRAAEKFFRDNPPSAGVATDAQVMAAVANYFAMHPAKVPTTDVDASVATYMSSNPPAPGPAGPQGDQGPQGLKGDVGPVGAAGADGVPGPKGDTGPQGLKGDPGSTGATGSMGIQGPAGLKGDVGAAGPVGPKGDTGVTGAQGPQGPQGVKGDIGIKGDTGAIGPTGAQGVKGDTGATGAAGQTLVGQVTIGETAAVAIALGIREVTATLAGTVPGERYVAFARSYKLNGATVAITGRPPGYAIADCVCNVAGTIRISLNAPLLAVGNSYSITCDIIKVNAS